MLKPLRCTRCGNHTAVTSAKTLAGRLLCATCASEIPLPTAPNRFDRQGMMRMGDDDGGDWGGGGDDSSEEEEDEEEDESGGKKKKKKKGFMARLLSGFITYVIAGVVLVLLCCCVGVAGWLGLLPSSPAFVGEWENSVSAMVKIKEKNEKGEDVEKEVPQEVTHHLNITKSDDKTGTGVYTIFEPDDKTSTRSFKYKDYDKEKNTVVFEMNNPDDKFWKDIKSPATFTFSKSGNVLTLTSGESMTFNQIVPVKEDKGGGGKKGGGKRR